MLAEPFRCAPVEMTAVEITTIEAIDSRAEMRPRRQAGCWVATRLLVLGRQAGEA